MRWYIFLFILPLVICVRAQTDNRGIEYYGTSNVRLQRPYPPPLYRPPPRFPSPNVPYPTPAPAVPIPPRPVEVATQPPQAVPLEPTAEVVPQPPVAVAPQPPVDVAPQPPAAVASQPPLVVAPQPSVVVANPPPSEIAYQPPVAPDYQPPAPVASVAPALPASQPPAYVSPSADVAPQPPVETSYPSVDATQLNPAVIVDGGFAAQPPAPAATQPPVVSAPYTIVDITPQPPQVATSQPSIEPAPQPSFDIAPLPGTGTAAQPPVVAGPQPPVAAAPPALSAAPGLPPPGTGSSYPLGPLPPLLPKPKPEREPDFIWHSQSTAYPPNTKPVTVQPVTIPPPVTARTPPVVVPTIAPQRENGSLTLDFSCKNGNGYYAIPNACDAYIECKQFIAMKYSCPDGLYFNSAAKWSDYPCAYPSAVQCKAGLENQNPIPTNQCPRQYGFFSMNDGDCSRYIMCQGGIGTIMNCPAGLVFNEVTDSCDWQENVPQCNPNVFKNFVCPDAPVDEYGFVSDIIYKYRYQNECKLYIACKKGHPRLLSCERGLAFDEMSQACINKNYVAGCSTATAYRK